MNYLNLQFIGVGENKYGADLTLRRLHRTEGSGVDFLPLCDCERSRNSPPDCFSKQPEAVGPGRGA